MPPITFDSVEFRQIGTPKLLSRLSARNPSIASSIHSNSEDGQDMLIDSGEGPYAPLGPGASLLSRLGLRDPDDFAIGRLTEQRTEGSPSHDTSDQGNKSDSLLLPPTGLVLNQHPLRTGDLNAPTRSLNMNVTLSPTANIPSIVHETNDHHRTPVDAHDILSVDSPKNIYNLDPKETVPRSTPEVNVSVEFHRPSLNGAARVSLSSGPSTCTSIPDSPMEIDPSSRPLATNTTGLGNIVINPPSVEAARLCNLQVPTPTFPPPSLSASWDLFNSEDLRRISFDVTAEWEEEARKRDACKPLDDYPAKRDKEVQTPDNTPQVSSTSSISPDEHVVTPPALVSKTPPAPTSPADSRTPVVPATTHQKPAQHVMASPSNQNAHVDNLNGELEYVDITQSFGRRSPELSPKIGPLVLTAPQINVGTKESSGAQEPVKNPDLQLVLPPRADVTSSNALRDNFPLSAGVTLGKPRICESARPLMSPISSDPASRASQNAGRQRASSGNYIGPAETHSGPIPAITSVPQPSTESQPEGPSHASEFVDNTNLQHLGMLKTEDGSPSPAVTTAVVSTGNQSLKRRRSLSIVVKNDDDSLNNKVSSPTVHSHRPSKKEKLEERYEEKHRSPSSHPLSVSDPNQPTQQWHAAAAPTVEYREQRQERRAGSFVYPPDVPSSTIPHTSQAVLSNEHPQNGLGSATVEPAASGNEAFTRSQAPVINPERARRPMRFYRETQAPQKRLSVGAVGGNSDAQYLDGYPHDQRRQPPRGDDRISPPGYRDVDHWSPPAPPRRPIRSPPRQAYERYRNDDVYFPDQQYRDRSKSPDPRPASYHRVWERLPVDQDDGPYYLRESIDARLDRVPNNYLRQDHRDARAMAPIDPVATSDTQRITGSRWAEPHASAVLNNRNNTRPQGHSAMPRTAPTNGNSGNSSYETDPASPVQTSHIGTHTLQPARNVRKRKASAPHPLPPKPNSNAVSNNGKPSSSTPATPLQARLSKRLSSNPNHEADQSPEGSTSGRPYRPDQQNNQLMRRLPLEERIANSQEPRMSTRLENDGQPIERPVLGIETSFNGQLGGHSLDRPRGHDERLARDDYSSNPRYQPFSPELHDRIFGANRGHNARPGSSKGKKSPPGKRY